MAHHNVSLPIIPVLPLRWGFDWLSCKRKPVPDTAVVSILPIRTAMLDFTSHLLEDYPRWGLLLDAYAQLQDEEPLTLAEPELEGEQAATHATRFFPRISELPGVDGAHLSPMHGRLIALGWLRFQLEDAQHGLQYRLSPEGRTALSSYSAPATEESRDSLADPAIA